MYGHVRRSPIPWVASQAHITMVASVAIPCRCQGTPTSQAMTASSPVTVAWTNPTARPSSDNRTIQLHHSKSGLDGPAHGTE
jgi:hypothetical protein